MTVWEKIRAAAQASGAEMPCPSGEYHAVIAAGDRRRMAVICDRADTSVLDLHLGEGASLSLVVLFAAEAFVECRVRQQAGSRCDVTVVQLSSANADLTFELDGPQAESRLGGLFLAAGEEHCEIGVRTVHRGVECRSESLVKGVAAGCATGEFRGLVYVAPGAQRTDARQTSRNIELSDTARIVTKPQLEIYADDVKCSHGATVGQADAEALFYMRQRGLDEAQARRLLIEGFVGDTVMHCGIEELREPLLEAVASKLENL